MTSLSLLLSDSVDSSVTDKVAKAAGINADELEVITPTFAPLGIPGQPQQPDGVLPQLAGAADQVANAHNVVVLAQSATVPIVTVAGVAPSRARAQALTSAMIKSLRTMALSSSDARLDFRQVGSQFTEPLKSHGKTKTGVAVGLLVFVLWWAAVLVLRAAAGFSRAGRRRPGASAT
jgi:hypothetical protein